MTRQERIDEFIKLFDSLDHAKLGLYYDRNQLLARRVYDVIETLFFPGNVHSNDLGVNALDILRQLRFEDYSDPYLRTGPNESIIIARWRNNPGKVPKFLTESKAVQWENVNWDLFRERFQNLKDTLVNC